VGTTVDVQWWIQDILGLKGSAASGHVHLLQP
jgi:hypothetical protein